MKLTISLPEEAIIRAKKSAESNGQTLSGLIRISLEKELDLGDGIKEVIEKEKKIRNTVCQQ